MKSVIPWRRRSHLGLLLSICLGCCLAAPPLGAQTGGFHSHVRVVLDTSGSMDTNDPKRLAVLSSILLRDLIDPNTTLGDSYEVIPFDPNWDGQGPVPTSTGDPIVHDFRNPDRFVRSMQGLKYTVKYTSFSPGLTKAVEELEATPGGDYDNRIAVLITDGVPISQWKDEDSRKIADELIPRMQAAGIRFYIMAFGTNASQERQYFQRLAASTGDLFVDADGSRLLGNMIRIFGKSFGYTTSNEKPIPGASGLDLEGGATPSRAAVVVMSDSAGKPDFKLTAPPRGTVNAPRQARAVSSQGASYALRWILSPHRGDYQLNVSGIGSGRVAVLRPSQLELSIDPAPPSIQAERTMAGEKFPILVVVSSPVGAQGDPGPVDLSFRTLGPREPDPDTGRLGDPAWESRFLGAPASGAAGQVGARGREYPLPVKFREHPDSPDKIYTGYLELKAHRREALVASRQKDYAHTVEVHPRVEIKPSPATLTLSPTALKRRDRVCKEFELELTSGVLPHRNQPEYGVRAFLRAPAGALGAELREASATLDGLPVVFEGRPGNQPGSWFSGHSLPGDQFLGPHELCVTVGRPTRGAPSNPVDLELQWVLNESPYDDFDVVRPLTAALPLAKPSWLETHRAGVFLGLLLLALLLLAWYTRSRPYLPEDLGFALAPDLPGAKMQGGSLPEPPLFVKLLALRDRRTIAILGQDENLGQVRPISDKIYSFRSHGKVQVRPVEGGENPAEGPKGEWPLEVERDYRLSKGEDQKYRFRLEYLGDRES